MQPSSISSVALYVEILLAFLRDEVLDGGARDLDEYTPLLAYGVLDSLSIVSVLSFVRERFHVEVTSEDITAANFETVQNIASMIDRIVVRRGGLQQELVSPDAVREHELRAVDFS